MRAHKASLFSRSCSHIKWLYVGCLDWIRLSNAYGASGMVQVGLGAKDMQPYGAGAGNNHLQVTTKVDTFSTFK